jgi:hypothetical protein
MKAVDLAHIEMENEDVDDDQRHQEARHRHAEEGNGRKQAVDPGILPGRGNDTERPGLIENSRSLTALAEGGLCCSWLFLEPTGLRT